MYPKKRRQKGHFDQVGNGSTDVLKKSKRTKADRVKLLGHFSDETTRTLSHENTHTHTHTHTHTYTHTHTHTPNTHTPCLLYTSPSPRDFG